MEIDMSEARFNPEGKEFLGVYRMPNKPNQNLPVFYDGDGNTVNIIGVKVNISRMVLVED
jgi:hypothetical protein